MLSQKIFVFVTLFATVASAAECGMDAEGQSTCPEEADEATLLQAKVKVERTEAAAEVKLAADADPATTKILEGVPIYNYHMAHPSGMNPSLLELSQKRRWITMFDKDVSNKELDDFCGGNCDTHGDTDHGGCPFAELTATEGELATALKKGKKTKYVEPDMEVEVPPDTVDEDSTVKKPKQKKGESLLDVSRDGEVPWGLDRIDAEEGLDDSYQVVVDSKEGYGAHVYVADTGVRTTHEDFEGRAIPYIDCAKHGGCTACNGVSNANNSHCSADSHGHGTHCAGTIGGRKYGVAKRAKLYAVKVLNPSGFTSWIINSLDWIETKGEKPAIWSASLGGGGRSQAYKDAIDDAVSKGIIVSVAAGNSNADACNFSPAYVPSAITVGSTTKSDKRSGFSNYGSCVDIWAPGSSILSATNKNDDGTKVMSGTSMACPHVSGVLALIMADNPALSPAQAEALLKQTAVSGKITDVKNNSVNLFLNSMYGEAPPPPTAPPGEIFEMKSGECTISEDRKCVSSPNYPLNYGVSQSCKIGLYGQKVKLEVEKFLTEKQYDKLTVNGQAFSGTDGPDGISAEGSIQWAADYSVPTDQSKPDNKWGWKFCAGAADDDSTPTSAAPTTAAPTTAAPTTAAPTTAAPTTQEPVEQALGTVENSVQALRNAVPSGGPAQQALQNVEDSVENLKAKIAEALQ